MKKILLPLIMIFIISWSKVSGQSFDWNLRGGINLMKSHTTGKDLSVLYHGGFQAGIRIASFGLYGEALYSVLENQYGGDPIGYFTPSVILKGYWLKFVFIEFGGTMLSKIGDSGVSNDLLNPDGELYMMAGMGAHISKIELSIRSTVKQSYGVFYLTAAFKF